MRPKQNAINPHCITAAGVLLQLWLHFHLRITHRLDSGSEFDLLYPRCLVAFGQLPMLPNPEAGRDLRGAPSGDHTANVTADLRVTPSGGSKTVNL